MRCSTFNMNNIQMKFFIWTSNLFLLPQLLFFLFRLWFTSLIRDLKLVPVSIWRDKEGVPVFDLPSTCICCRGMGGSAHGRCEMSLFMMIFQIYQLYPSCQANIPFLETHTKIWFSHMWSYITFHINQQKKISRGDGVRLKLSTTIF